MPRPTCGFAGDNLVTRYHTAYGVDAASSYCSFGARHLFAQTYGTFGHSTETIPKYVRIPWISPLFHILKCLGIGCCYSTIDIEALMLHYGISFDD